MEHQRRLSQIRQQGREERRRQEQASQARRGRKQRQQLRKEERHIAHDVQLLLRTESADSAIRMVAGSASRLEIREDLVVDRLLHACFGPIPRGCMTMQAEASSVGRSQQCFHEDVQTLAAAVFCCILSFLESMASHVLWGMPKQGQIAWGGGGGVVVCPDPRLASCAPTHCRKWFACAGVRGAGGWACFLRPLSVCSSFGMPFRSCTVFGSGA